MATMYIKFDLKSEQIPYNIVEPLSSDINFRYKVQNILGQNFEVAAVLNSLSQEITSDPQTGVSSGKIVLGGALAQIDSVNNSFELPGLNSNALFVGTLENGTTKGLYVTWDAVAVDAFVAGTPGRDPAEASNTGVPQEQTHVSTFNTSIDFIYPDYYWVRYDTPGPVITVADVSVTEGAQPNAVFKVSLSGAATTAVKVNYATVDGSAVAGQDYGAQPGTITFNPGETTKDILVPITSDDVGEPTETFSLTLQDPIGGLIARPTATGTINDQSLSFTKVSVSPSGLSPSIIEGNSGTTELAFTINREGKTDIQQRVVWEFDERPDALSQRDLPEESSPDGSTLSRGSVTFLPGDTSKLVRIQINGDRFPEKDEPLYIKLTSNEPDVELIQPAGPIAVILNDDGPQNSREYVRWAWESAQGSTLEEKAEYAGELIRGERKNDGQNTELRDAEYYLLGFQNASSPSGVVSIAIGTPLYVAFKSLAKAVGLDPTVTDNPTSAPGGIGAAFQGLMDGLFRHTPEPSTRVEAIKVLQNLPSSSSLTAAQDKSLSENGNNFTTQAAVVLKDISFTSFLDQLNVKVQFDQAVGISQGTVDYRVIFDTAIGELVSGPSDNIILIGTIENEVEKQKVISAGAGNDIVVSDSVVSMNINGDAGNDYIVSGDGADVLKGGAGNDYLAGENGADTFIGGAGDDILHGGSQPSMGPDTFLFSLGDGHDTILSLQAGEDTLNFSGAGLTLSALRIADGTGGAELTFVGVVNAPSVTVEGVTAAQVQQMLSAGRIAGEPEAPPPPPPPPPSDPEPAWTQTIPVRGEYRGGNGADAFKGTSGADRMTGGNGDDIAWGGAGNDTIDGGSGKDWLRGQTGNDTLIGGAGDDRLEGDEGNDKLSGGGGNDHLAGGVGTDDLKGDSGNDRLDGGDGADKLYGGAGNDLIFGGAGNDTLRGEAGNDRMAGGAGTDTFYLDAGLDTIIFAKGDGRDTVMDFRTGQDKVLLQGFDFGSNGLTFTEFKTMVTQTTGRGGDAVLGIHDDGALATDTLILTAVNLASITETQFHDWFLAG